MATPAKKGPPRAFPPLVSQADPKSLASEAYRTLRTNIQFASLDQPYRSILVTSSTRAEGKTTTVANLGAVCAQAGSRVCLLDADLRRPSLHRVFGFENAAGVTTAVVEGLPFAKFAQPSRIPNLSVVTSGPLPPNPAELVGSKRMRDLLAGATSDFDLVLIDSPPVVAVSDSLALSAGCDGVILVIRVGTAPHEVIRRTAEHIEAVKGRILGVILNNVNLRRDGYYSDYYHSYYGRRPKQ